MHATETPVPLSRRRRWSAFSLRAFFIAITLTAVLCALLGRQLLHLRQERAAVDKITSIGGRADCRHSADLAREGLVAQWIAWLCWENSSSVTGVSLNGTAVTDEDLQALSRLTYLDGLDLSRTGVTDAGLQHLKQLPHLRYVNLHRTRVTDAGIRDLKEAAPGLMVDWEPPIQVP